MMELLVTNKRARHTKCAGYEITHPDYGVDYLCGYNTTISCDECKYNVDPGRKDPQAKCNQES